MEPMRRKLVWVESQNFQGWSCSDCAWVFSASWPLVGKSIDEMKTEFGQQRDKEFASHVCAEHPRAADNPHQPNHLWTKRCVIVVLIRNN
jgi:Zn-finger protein